MRVAIKNRGQEKLALAICHHPRVCWSTLCSIYVSINHTVELKVCGWHEYCHFANEKQGGAKTLCRSMRPSYKKFFTIIISASPQEWDYSLGRCHRIEALKWRCQAVNYISESIMPLSERL